MPFISRGTTVGFARLDEKPMPFLLEELIRKKFTGRVEFDMVCNGSRIVGAIELEEGRIVGAEVETPRVVRGVDAFEDAVLKRGCRGYAEIIELDPERVRVDLTDNPAARLDPETAIQLLSKALEALRHEEKPAEERVETVAPPVKPAPPQPQQPPAAKPEEEEAPTAPIVAPPPESKPKEAPEAVAEVERKLSEVPVAPSEREIIERLDSSLFDAIIVLKGVLSESGAVAPGDAAKLVERVTSISKGVTDKLVVMFVNDRLNEIKGKLVAYNGALVAVLVKRGDRTLVDRDGLEELAKFPRSLLYSVYLVEPSVDETLYKLAQEAAKRAIEAKEAEKGVGEEVRREEGVEEKVEQRRVEEAEGKVRESERKRRRLFSFFRRR